MAHVLLVDDEAVVRLLVAHQLETAGHRITPAADLDSIDPRLLEEVDLVCCDLNLDGSSGLDLWDRVSAMQNRPLFLLLTGTEQQADVADPRARLVDAYLTKPTSTGELIATVDSLLESGVRQAVG